MDTATIVLGIDFGTRRMGIAVGNRITQSARALMTIPSVDWQAFNKLVRQWRPDAFIIGMPLDKDGSEQAITKHTKQFIQALKEKYPQPVFTIDERYTTIEANKRLRQARASGQKTKRVKKGDDDAMAAQIILENWLGQ